MKPASIFFLVLFSPLGLSVGAQEIPEPAPYPPDLIPTEGGCPAVDDWGAPGGVQAAEDVGGIRVSWIPSPEAPTRNEGFQVVRSMEPEGPWEPIAVVHETRNMIIDTTAVPDTFYWYRVRGFQGGLCTPFSEAVRGIRQ